MQRQKETFEKKTQYDEAKDADGHFQRAMEVSTEMANRKGKTLLPSYVQVNEDFWVHRPFSALDTIARWLLFDGV